MGTRRFRKAGAVFLLSGLGLAGACTPAGQRASCSVRAFAGYYRVLGSKPASSGAWKRITLSAMLALADPANAPGAACSKVSAASAALR